MISQNMENLALKLYLKDLLGKEEEFFFEFEIVSILDYKGIQQMNENGQVRLSARIRSDKRDEYIQKAVKETWVEILGYV